MKSLARLRVFAAAGLIWLALGLPAALAQFVGGIDDLPLMPGLTDIPDAGVVFETPAGRIVEAQALTGGLNKPGILGFYDRTLPQLGWTKIKSGHYRREGESLILEFPEGPVPTVRFRLAPGG